MGYTTPTLDIFFWLSGVYGWILVILFVIDMCVNGDDDESTSAAWPDARHEALCDSKDFDPLGDGGFLSADWTCECGLPDSYTATNAPATYSKPAKHPRMPRRT